jgi:hypothetical protein
METINKGKRSTAGGGGQQAEMSREEKMLRLAVAAEVLETVIERAIRARFGMPG